MKKTVYEKIKMMGDIPQPRFGHTFTLVSKTKAVLFGGAVSVSGKFIITNETFLYDFQTSIWKKLNFYNNFVPCERAAHAACMVADMQMVIYGGAASGSQSLLKDELYLLDLKNQPVWRIIDVIPKNNTPGQRYGHVMVFNKPHLIIFAGNSGNKVENDVWILNIQKGPFSWLKYQFENGRMPCPRVYHSAALCQQGKATSMMVVFGGRKQNTKKDHNGSQRDINVSALNDIWGLVKHRNGVWDWNTPPRTDNYVPICRYQHLICFMGSKLIIMGGRTNNPQQSVSFIEVYDTETALWQKIPSISRYRHAIVLQKNCKLFVHGGFQPQFISQPLDALVSIDLSMLLNNTNSLEESNGQQQNLKQIQQSTVTSPGDSNQTLRKNNDILSQTQPNIISALTNPRNINTPSRRDSAATKLGLREIGQSERNVSNNSRIRSIMDNGKSQRDLTPSRIINSSKNTRLSTQVVIAKGDKNSLQVERVPVNSLMQESKKLNNQNYQDSSCSNAFDQGLQQLIDNILIILMPINGNSKIMNSNIFPLKKDKIYRLCHQVSKILVSQSSLIGIRTPIKIFGAIYGQHSQLLRFFQNFDYPDERQMQTFQYVFLGNYVDKGFNSLQTICTLMALKIKYPEHIHLLRGKHQDININRISGLGEQCQSRLGEDINDPQSVFHCLNNMFDLLPLAAAVEDKFLCLNGGFGNVQNLIQIKNVVRPVKVKQNSIAMELLWADVAGKQNSLLQGYKAKKLNDQQYEMFLDENGLDMIINTKDGLINGIEQNKFQLSIFSVTNFNNKNNKACILKINKNLQVIPQMLKSVPFNNSGQKIVQWVNENQCKTNMQLNQNQIQFRKTMFQN